MNNTTWKSDDYEGFTAPKLDTAPIPLISTASLERMEHTAYDPAVMLQEHSTNPRPAQPVSVEDAKAAGLFFENRMVPNRGLGYSEYGIKMVNVIRALLEHYAKEADNAPTP